MTQPEETTAANLLLVNTVHHVLSAHVGSETDHRTGRTTYKASLKVEGLEPWVDVRGEAAAELFDAMPQLPVHLLLLSGPSAADTAALIARLHEQLTESNQARDASFAATSKAQDERDQARVDLEASKAECLQWRKDIDAERATLKHVREMLCDAEVTGDRYYKALEQTAAERDEQRARAEKAEGELIKARYECRAELVAMRQSLDIAHRNIDEDAKERYAIGQLVGAPEIGVELREHIADVMAGLRTQNNLQRMEIVQLQSSIDEARANFVTVDRMLVERTREREEARERIARALVREEGLIRTEAAVIKELDEARADSLKAGLVGREMAENLDAVSAECLKAQALAQMHSADCDRALRERDEAREQLAKLECRTRPAHWRTLDRLAWREMHGLYESFLCQGAKIKPVPCSLCLQPDVTSKPHPHARCANHAASEPSSTEPRFKVGQRVVETAIAWEVGEILLGAYEWWYRAPGSTWVEESKLKPAPKFAVGEWVTFDGYTGEIKSYSWGLSSRTEWIYDVLSAGVFGEPCLQWRRGEHALTAQTPQHKHDCKGCVFLGRMGEADLYLEGDKRTLRAVYSSDGCCISCTAAMGPDLTEARRRAVARGLVKP